MRVRPEQYLTEANMEGQDGQDLLEVVVTHGDGEVLMVVAGELDLSTAPKLLDLMQRTMEPGLRRLVCDIADLRYIDSTGLSVMLTAHKHMELIGGTLILRSPAPGARRLFEIAGVDGYLVIEGPEPSS
jgi:anti-sigma B factor antagonist